MAPRLSVCGTDLTAITNGAWDNGPFLNLKHEGAAFSRSREGHSGVGCTPTRFAREFGTHPRPALHRGIRLLESRYCFTASLPISAADDPVVAHYPSVVPIRLALNLTVSSYCLSAG